MTDPSLRDFTAALASSAPTPGGGGASALAGALGAALGGMAVAITARRAPDAETEAVLRGLTERAEALRVRLLDCVQRDAEAFAPLAEAYRIPRDDPSRAETLERCLRGAAAVPMEIFDLCCEGIGLLRELSGVAGPAILSDVATGAVLCWGAMYGAAINVKVNTKPMRDRAYAEALNTRVDRGMEAYWPVAERVYEEIYRRYC